MKKILLYVSALAVAAAGFVGCTQQQKWSDQQREALREALRDYRQMAYLNNLDQAEFMIFADTVAGELESTYPIYTSFIEMPGVNDTIDMVVVTTVVEQLNADAANMRHLFPYSWLVAEGVLPAGLDRAQQRSFYTCFANQVDSAGWSFEQFYLALLANTTDKSVIRQMQTQCANDLFGWVVTEVEVVETAE